MYLYKHNVLCITQNVIRQLGTYIAISNRNIGSF